MNMFQQLMLHIQEIKADATRKDERINKKFGGITIQPQACVLELNQAPKWIGKVSEPYYNLNSCNTNP